MSRPEIVDDVMAERRAAGITVAPEAALHRALQARTDELERVRAECSELRQALAAVARAAASLSAPDGGAPTAPDVAPPCAPAAGAADPPRLSGLAAPRPLATWWPASDRRGRP
jgi:hypothetical protein